MHTCKSNPTIHARYHKAIHRERNLCKICPITTYKITTKT
ncbi:MAG: hypothetical protein IJN02_00565 [Bacteroidales bacterium]|nr:hypothetical protein [Bacteroidales bacterium]MBQ6687706.1 hypothetical protein [Bacteroidales bacterium]